MSQPSDTLPLYRIAGWGFTLNVVWEFGQCFFLYDMWGMGFWRSAVWMWGAIIGDVLVVLGVALLATWVAGASRLTPPSKMGWGVLLAVGFAASVGLEWLARTLGFWDYSSLMPTLEVASHTVGLSPIVQITVLPALSVFLATRR